MSYRPHPLRQTHTADHPVDRHLSTTSSASSGYSFSSGQFDLSRTTTQSSSASSGYGSMGHKRGKSEANGRLSSSPKSPEYRPQTSTGNMYSAARQSLRPLPQAPVSAPTTPPRDPYRHDRGHILRRSPPPRSHLPGPELPQSAPIPWLCHVPMVSYQGAPGSLRHRCLSTKPMPRSSPGPIL